MPRSARPGQPVRGSKTGRPLMAALDLLGRRWALRVLWELRAAPLGFREIQVRCDGMSSSVLRDRLRELEEAQLVERGPEDRWALTDLGTSLGTALAPLKSWSVRWAARVVHRS